MSRTIKFSVSDENYKLLVTAANDANLSLQEYLRSTLFPNQKVYSTITKAEIIKRALEVPVGEEFTIPGLFDDWSFPNGVGGQLCRKIFLLFKTEYSGYFEYTGGHDEHGRALYLRK